jgi:hypothetical protein
MSAALSPSRNLDAYMRIFELRLQLSDLYNQQITTCEGQ